MRNTTRLLMAGTFLSSAVWLTSAQAGVAPEGTANVNHARADQSTIILAQAPPEKKEEPAKPAAPPAAKPAPPPPRPPAAAPPPRPAPPPPPAARPAPPPPPAARPAPPPPPAARPAPPPPPAARPAPPPPPAARPPERAPERAAPPPPPAAAPPAARPPVPPAPPAAAPNARPENARPEGVRPEGRPGGPPPGAPGARPEGGRPEGSRPGEPPRPGQPPAPPAGAAPGAAPATPPAPPPPGGAQNNARPPAPAAQGQQPAGRIGPPQPGTAGNRFGPQPQGADRNGRPGPGGRPGASPAPATPPANAGIAPNTQAAPLARSGVPSPQQQQIRPIAPTRVGQGLTPQSAQGQPLRDMQQLRGQRREVQEGGRTVFREPDRTIIRDNGRTFIRHNDDARFAYGARNVTSARRGVTNVTTVVMPTGDRIINVVDDNGYLIRRSRVLPGGREIILIDNRPRGPNWSPADFFIAGLVAPIVRIPRDRYIVDYDQAYNDPTLIYDTFEAPPVDPIERAYTLDEIRYNAPIRDLMPRIDLNTVNFESGSWELTDDQIDKLGAVADGINKAIQRNPRTVFLIEGHTDATGDEVDNLSLSDRRAETVAIALSQQFGVPAENLTTQGYGEQYLKVPTQGPERANRRVTVRNITPLLVGQAGAPPPR